MRPRFLILLATAAAICAPVRAELVARGAHREHEPRLRLLYDSFPARGKGVDLQVTELPAEEWELASFLVGDGVIGVYFPGRNRTFLTAAPAEDPEYIFAHEYGHHVWYTALTDAERAGWLRYWPEHLDGMPRAYARSSAGEGWAECFASTYCPGHEARWGFASDDVKAAVRSYFRAGVASPAAA